MINSITIYYKKLEQVKFLLNTTNIVGYKEIVNRINNMICNMLPVNENKFLINSAIDFINDEQQNQKNYLKVKQTILII